MQEIRPPQRWRKEKEQVRIQNATSREIEIHYFERGPATLENVEIFSPSRFKRNFIFVDEV